MNIKKIFICILIFVIILFSFNCETSSDEETTTTTVSKSNVNLLNLTLNYHISQDSLINSETIKNPEQNILKNIDKIYDRLSLICETENSKSIIKCAAKFDGINDTTEDLSNKTESKPILLNIGWNNINLMVLSEDNSSTKLYSIKILRIKDGSSDNTIKELKISSGNVFYYKEKNYYIGNVLENIDSVSLRIKASPLATILVNNKKLENDTSSDIFNIYSCTDLTNDNYSNDFNIEVIAENLLSNKYLLKIFKTPKNELIKLNSGKFEMGYKGISEPTSDVEISNFSIGKYEVTYELWENVRQWSLYKGYSFRNNGKKGKTNKHPVTNICWFDAIAWCNALSEKNGLEPIYYTSEDLSMDKIYKNSNNDYFYSSKVVKWNGNGYRLPTEAEWEYAARSEGKTEGNRFSGFNNNNINDYVWYYNNSNFSTQAAGTKLPNIAGIYDMSGNVTEWCWDWYGLYTKDNKKDPPGPENGERKIVRGGSYADFENVTYTSYRIEYGKRITTADDTIGFRIVKK